MPYRRFDPLTAWVPLYLFGLHHHHHNHHRISISVDGGRRQGQTDRGIQRKETFLNANPVNIIMT